MEDRKKPPLLARVDRFGEEKVRCIVDFRGFPLPVAFPLDVIKHYDLSKGDEFDWFPAKGRPVEIQDCEPLRDKPAFAPGEEEEIDQLISTLPSYDEEEIERLNAFVERGRPVEELLKEMEEKKRRTEMIAFFKHFKGPFVYDNDLQLIRCESEEAGGSNVLEMRGWGFLTGKGGGLGLDPDDAAEIQDELGELLVEFMNAKAIQCSVEGVCPRCGNADNTHMERKQFAGHLVEKQWECSCGTEFFETYALEMLAKPTVTRKSTNLDRVDMGSTNH